jgi:hypothetical protein
VKKKRDRREPTARATFLIFVGSDERLLSRLTVRVTGRQLPDKSDQWSHMALGFEMTTGETVYFEALFGRRLGGPKSLEGLRAWAEEKPERRRWETVRLPLTAEESERAFALSRSWVGVLGYAEWQLPAMWLFERLGLPIPATPWRVVCSEFPARVLVAFGSRVDLCDEKRRTPDYVNPNSAWRKARLLREEWT